ncbi:hypothetical protein NSZ01_35710 [Nocardioides szechwanensis]|nr:hypothetical protein NSZ01_35710 [Nocardioides szechwanensis]
MAVANPSMPTKSSSAAVRAVTRVRVVDMASFETGGTGAGQATAVILAPAAPVEPAPTIRVGVLGTMVATHQQPTAGT